MVTLMGRPTSQDPVLRGLALVVAAQVLVIKVKVNMVVLIISLVRVASSKVISQGIRVIQSNLMGANTTFSLQVVANRTRRFISGRFMQWSRLFCSI